MLYLINTADLPKTSQTPVATFADDATISTLLPRSLRNYKIKLTNKLRPDKVVGEKLEVTFTTERENCPLNATTEAWRTTQNSLRPKDDLASPYIQ